jgi:hypothetical protein
MARVIRTTQRNATRNQSTVDFQRENLFLFGNRYSEAVFNNNTGDNLNVESGILVIRNTAAAAQILPTTNLTLASIIGILKYDGESVLEDADTTNVNYCTSGDIDAGLIVFPAGVTLNTVVGTKILKDVLTDLGFVLFNVEEGSNFDN